MKITYYGHSCFLVEAGGKSLLFDPFISGNPLAGHIQVSKIRCDYILISHAHGDHIADVEAVMQHNPSAVIVGTWEIYEYYTKKGFTAHPMNKGGWWNFDFGRVKMVQAVHTSSFSDGSSAGEPVGFVIVTSDGNLYFSGDTALTMDMQLIPLTCPPLDVAILPIGSNFTMDAHDAAIAAEFVQCQKVVGCHYDTFGFVKIDQQAAIETFANKNKELILMQIGNTQKI